MIRAVYVNISPVGTAINKSIPSNIAIIYDIKVCLPFLSRDGHYHEENS